MSGAKSRESWDFMRAVLDDMTRMVTDQAETELELLEGLRALGRVTTLCSELSLDLDATHPRFMSMNTAARFVGGPNPDGEYYIAMIDGRERYRVSGVRGTTAYLGLQVLAGRGLTPRRMGAYLSDDDLVVSENGSFSVVLAGSEPTAIERDGAQWLPVPDDASAVVIREYVGDRATERGADLEIMRLGGPKPAGALSDEMLAEQFSSMGWTIAKLLTLHQTIRPELLDMPNTLVTAEASELGSENTTPDNLYMIGMFRLGDGEYLRLDVTPPETRYWSVTLENIWHECVEPRHRRSSLTSAHVTAADDGSVRIVIGPQDPGDANWLDTGGRHRGFVIIRWLDNPDPPDVGVSVVDSEKTV